MLKLINIKKDYLSADDKVQALRGISLSFRESEFVSVLGPSGCGKTTLLNIIGGLDHYTEGDLVITGKSTGDFTDKDWDAYRNHSIGFVFQNYNLIPHQSVLANVELALTLSGVSKAERRRRAKEALAKVGLSDQIKKRPNQLSGGQMQRVAIARALVNDPEILLADEPTGALDTVTSIQIMELLKEISREKLVIMVTHNPDLAAEYSTRIIKLLDGKLIDDSNPYDGSDSVLTKKEEQKKKKPSMSLFTALSLSMNNLMTKKGRTILTSFAGSIGIIGIALILSLSNGINAYIRSVQEEALTSYPIVVEAERVDLTALMTSLMGINQKSEENKHELDAVYSSSILNEMINTMMQAQVQTNNLTLFKEFLDSDEEIQKYISNIQYEYDLNMSILTKDDKGEIIISDLEKIMSEVFEKMGFSDDLLNSQYTDSGFSSIPLWQEMLPNKDGTGISNLLREQYDVIYGAWPKEYNEIVLVVSDNNELSDLVLCGLGLIPTDRLASDALASGRGEELSTEIRSWSYEDICNKTFRAFLPIELYQKNPNGGYTLLTDMEKGTQYLYGNPEKGIDLKISGILRKNPDSNAAMLNGALCYTTELTQHLLQKIENSDLIREQKENPEKDVLLNLPFLPEDFTEYTDEEKINLIGEHIKSLSAQQKAKIFVEFSAIAPDEYVNATVQAALGQMTRSEMQEIVMQFLSAQENQSADLSYITDYINQMSDAELYDALAEGYAEQIREQYRLQVTQSFAAVPEAQLAAMLDAKLASPDGFSKKQLVELYELYMPATHSESTLDKNLDLLGCVKKESPGVIRIYTNTFENKDMIAELIVEYNKDKSEDDVIEYTDLFAFLMSSFTTIIDAISYVLVAFVSISLVVSSIMIGIITYISVLERTKEIGILRAIGASKRDISRVFNAESVIEGFAAGLIGIGITLLLILPINAIIRHFTQIPTLGAVLPLGGYLLILVSVLLSFIAGLLPSKMAAGKDPVVALRTE